MKNDLVLNYSSMLSNIIVDLTYALSDKKDIVEILLALKKSTTRLNRAVRDAGYAHSLSSMMYKLNTAKWECNQTRSLVSKLLDLKHITYEMFCSVAEITDKIHNLLAD